MHYKTFISLRQCILFTCYFVLDCERFRLQFLDLQDFPCELTLRLLDLFWKIGPLDLSSLAKGASGQIHQACTAYHSHQYKHEFDTSKFLFLSVLWWHKLNFLLKLTKMAAKLRIYAHVTSYTCILKPFDPATPGHISWHTAVKDRLGAVLTNSSQKCLTLLHQGTWHDNLRWKTVLALC